jgi:hypothetical protein
MTSMFASSDVERPDRPFNEVVQGATEWGFWNFVDEV